MCAQCNLVTSKSNKIFMLCIYIQLCTVLRKAKQDDSEFLVGLLPFQVFEKKREHFHQLIVTRVLHDGKKGDCSSSNLLPPLFSSKFIFLNFLLFNFCFVSFFSNRTFSTPPPPELRESHSQFLRSD